MGGKADELDISWKRLKKWRLAKEMDVSAQVFRAKGFNSWVEDVMRNILRQLLLGDLRPQLIGAS